jgi:hypothetical protein
MVLIVLLLPFCLVVLVVGEDRANVHLLTIVMQGGNQSSSIAANVEDRQLPDLIGARKECAQFGERMDRCRLECPTPVKQARFGFRMFGRKFVQAFTSDDMDGPIPSALSVLTATGFDILRKP